MRKSLDSDYFDPVVWNSTNGFLVSGHLRVKVLTDMGATHADAVVKDYDESTHLARMICANQQQGEDIGAAIIELTDELRADGIDMAMVGMTDEQIQEIADSMIDDTDAVVEDDAPEPPDDPLTEPGRIYQLGKHRLMCGDSTDARAVSSMMCGERADICFTSPPYNAGAMEISGNASTQKKYQLFDDDGHDWYNLVKGALVIMLQHSDEVFYNIGMVQGNKVDMMRLPVAMQDQFKDIIYWSKNTCAPHIQPGVINNRVEMIMCFGGNLRKFKNAQFSQGSYWNVIEGPNASGNEFADIHKATFPAYLPENIISNFCPRMGVVVDCFGGTGTTMIAAEQVSRSCRMMELDPKYCDVIVRRWANLVGADASEIFETGVSNAGW